MDRAGPRAFLIVLTFLGFISLGLPDGSTGVAWPSLRTEFALNQAALGELLLFVGAGYLTSSFFSGYFVGRLGIGVLLATSCFLVSAGLGGYAFSPRWIVVLGSGVVIGLGSGAIDAGLNSFAAAQFAPRYMSWLHASYGIGAMGGPIIMSRAILTADSWRIGYSAIAVALGLMGVLFVVTNARWRIGGDGERERADTTVRFRDVAAHPAVQLNVIAFFLYCGVEASAGQWCYTILTESRGFAPGPAGLIAGCYWGALAIGRVVYGFLVERYGAVALLRVTSTLVILGAMLFASGLPASVSMPGILVLGFALAPYFPGMMGDTPSRVGERFAPYSIGFQVAAATLGIGVFPAVTGAAAARWGLESIPAILCVIAVLFIAVHRKVAGMQAAGTESRSEAVS